MHTMECFCFCFAFMEQLDWFDFAFIFTVFILERIYSINADLSFQSVTCDKRE